MDEESHLNPFQQSPDTLSKDVTISPELKDSQQAGSSFQTATSPSISVQPNLILFSLPPSLFRPP